MMLNIINLKNNIQAKQKKNKTDKKVLELLDCIIENKDHLCFLIPPRGNAIAFVPNDTESVFSDVVEIKKGLGEVWVLTPPSPVGEYTITIIERKYINKSKIILQERSVDLSKMNFDAMLDSQEVDDIKYYRGNSLDKVIIKSKDQGAIEKATTLIENPNTLYFLNYKKNGRDIGKFIRASRICGKELDWRCHEYSKEDGNRTWAKWDKVDVIEYRFKNNNAKRKLQLIVEPVRVDLRQVTELYTIPQFSIILQLNGGKLPSNFSHIFDVK